MNELLRAEDLAVYFSVKDVAASGWFAKKKVLKAVDGVSFSVKGGETLAIVGESGCGKTTLGRALVGLNTLTDGRIFLDGEDTSEIADKKQLYRQMQFIFQDPYSSLNPRMTVRETLIRPMKIHGLHSGRDETEQRLAQLLETVGLSKDQSLRYPHELSGGQKQKIGIARMLAVEPRLVVADEPTSALDVCASAQILNILLDLKEKLKLTMIFISHDLDIVEYISDRICVMYLGKIMEEGATKDVISHPLHPYTKALLSAIPKNPTQEKLEPFRLSGSIPSPIDLPVGCRLFSRCPYSCAACRRAENVTLREISPGRKVACAVCK